MKNVYSVGQLNIYIKNMFDQDYFLRNVCVTGEVLNCKYHTSGHIYFSLKDEQGSIACIMFAGNRRNGLSFPMKDGDKIIVTGNVSVYEKDGKYQLYVRQIQLSGEGEQHARLLALKKELQEMGMFATEYKRPIPRYIKRLGVLTASTGAAVWDIKQIAERRNPFVQIVLYSTLVQGERAPENIVHGLEMLQNTDVDVIILGRGGGSQEDLWAFNERIVAEAIFHCSVPIISAVGHQINDTIADLAADLRAETPSAAAELAVTDIREILTEINGYQTRMKEALNSKSLRIRQQIESYQKQFQYLSPENILRDNRMKHSEAYDQFMRLMEHKIKDHRYRLSVYLERFAGLSPLGKLNQGYSYIADESGQNISSITQVKKGDILEISVTDGRIQAEVHDVRKEQRSIS